MGVLTVVVCGCAPVWVWNFAGLLRVMSLEDIRDFDLDFGGSASLRLSEDLLGGSAWRGKRRRTGSHVEEISVDSEDGETRVRNRRDVSRPLAPVDADPPRLNVIIVKLALPRPDAADLGTFFHPVKLTKAINDSVFGKYILEGTLKVLGKGDACTFRVSDVEKVGPLEEIVTLGGWAVKCHQPESSRNLGCSYGTISPVAPEISDDEVKSVLKTVSDSDARLVGVQRLLRAAHGGEAPGKVPSLTLRVVFRGPLPKRVAIGHLYYPVRQYTFPLPKCYWCLRYGHFAITCKNSKLCSNCSGKDHVCQGCPNPKYCFYCDAGHAPRDSDCGAYLRAREINQGNTSPDDVAVKRLLSAIQPRRSSRGSAPPSALSQFSTRASPPESYPPAGQSTPPGPQCSAPQGALYSQVLLGQADLPAVLSPLPVPSQPASSPSLRTSPRRGRGSGAPVEDPPAASVHFSQGGLDRGSPRVDSQPWLSAPSSWTATSSPGRSRPVGVPPADPGVGSGSAPGVGGFTWSGVAWEILLVVCDCVSRCYKGTPFASLVPVLASSLLPIFLRVSAQLSV